MNRAWGHQTRDGLTIIYNVVTYIIRLSATPIPPPGSMISVGEGGGEGVEVGSVLKNSISFISQCKITKNRHPPPPTNNIKTCTLLLWKMSGSAHVNVGWLHGLRVTFWSDDICSKCNNRHKLYLLLNILDLFPDKFYYKLEIFECTN